ncbi:hypothetical protein [Mycobacterium sp. D16R24]|uniref:hypothetical protein n=1 Tax=Mycobacterium sp. D16R24 TaxID=1855656 RepID=UPI00257087D0|nr:hypothetical protein [Mycobacterium sp. D16R24]
MKAVWLSSTYYLDEAVENLSPTAERFMLRAIAYCGNAESSGFLSKSAIKLLGLPNPQRLVQELVQQEILEPQPDGRWYFRSWSVWQSGGESLLERRKADRDRQSRLRESRKQSRDMSRDASRDSSRDVTPPEESRGEKNSTYVESATPDSTEREPRSAPVMPAANRLVSEHIPARHPASIKTELRLQASALLKDGQPEALVAEALQLWTTKNLHPKTLPSLVSELINGRNRPAGQPVESTRVAPATRKVGIGLDLAKQFATPPEQPALEA